MVIEHQVPRTDLALGIVRAEKISPEVTPEPLEAELRALLALRRHGLLAEEEQRRAAVRDVLRNGRYKPTGRAKPASEYLLRSAQAEPEADAPEAGFPRINGPVDVCNYISLRSLLPISLWDVDLAGARRFRFRLGRAGEAYVFNAGGQTIDLADLVVGCSLDGAAEDGRPIVNPVRDSLATKTTESTRAVAAAVYAPLDACSPEELARVCATFADLLARCGSTPEVAYGVVLPGEVRSV